MSNNINHEIKTIVAELQSMSPRTQLEIVRLCKRVAELTPDYIEALSSEDLATFTALLESAKTNLQNEIDAVDARITTEVNAIDSELTEINNAIELLQTRINDCENDIDDEINDRVALINKNQTTNATNIVNESSDINIESHDSVNITGYDEIYMQDDNGHSLAIDASGFALNTNDHNLTFGNNGKLEIDGTEVGGGYDIYEHHVTLVLSRTIGGITYNLRFNVYFISTDGSNVDLVFIRNWLYSNGYRASSEAHWTGELTISGVRYECGIYSEMNTHIRCRYWNGTSMNNDIVDNEIAITNQAVHKINN